MVAESTLRRLEAEFDSPTDQLLAILDLFERGASPQFVALYRRDEAGDAGEDRLTAIHERARFLNELERRKENLLRLLGERATSAASTPARFDLAELTAMLAETVDQDLVDDIDHALRPNEHTGEARIAQLGLTPLFQAILRRELGEQTPQEAAQPYVSDVEGMRDTDEVLAQIVLALAERFGEDPVLRSRVRDELSRGILEARASAAGESESQKPGGEKFAKLIGAEEPVRRISAQRMLALRRAEREGFVSLRLKLEPGREVALFRERFAPGLDPESSLGRFLDLVFGHAYDQYVHRACEERVRHQIKEKADREQVRNFVRALRAQLMAPGSGDKPVAAIRVAGKSVWLAIVGAGGAPSVKRTFGIPDDEAARGEMLDALVAALNEDFPAYLVVPHGRRENAAREIADQMLAKLPPETARPKLVAMDETSSVVWATSAQARKRHGNSDTGLRATLSLARRVHDPLFELMRVDVRGLGFGENLTEVHQGLLKRQLDAAISSCLARIGVDVNRADQALLARLPGITRELAEAIVKERSSNGPFKSLQELSRVAALDDQRRNFIVGFLRIHGGEDVFDATTIHPENRTLVSRIAALAGKPASELLGERVPRIDLSALPESEFGRLRVRDVLDGIALGTRDPRGEIEVFANEGVTSFQELRVDQPLEGRITSLTDFGAFVDLGIAQDGLIHVSQIPPARLRDPDQGLRVGEIVRVWVMNLDEGKRKIGLTMWEPRHLREGRAPTLGERLDAGGRRRDRKTAAPAAQSRAARAPEGQRPGGRRGPNARPGGGKPRGDGPPRESRENFDYDDRGPRRGRGSDSPRVFTVESEKEAEASRGKKGELRSLSALKALLGGSKPSPDSGSES
jgi:uncharacterized protein